MTTHSKRIQSFQITVLAERLIYFPIYIEKKPLIKKLKALQIMFPVPDNK
jgi:hypothetical protein